MIVKGIGPIPCDYYLCGTTPGRDEDRRGIPFVGKTGQELDRHLDGDRLPARTDIFLDNIYERWRGKDYFYTTADYQQDIPHLERNLVRVSPSIVIAMGREAIRYFLGDVDVDDVHGLPWIMPRELFVPLRLNGWAPKESEPIIFPLYHIAAGFRSPDTNALVSYDFEQLKSFFAGELKPRRLYDDPYPNPVYTLLTGDEVCRALAAL